MHAVMRYYHGPGAPELFDELAQHTKEIEPLIRGVTGFVAYSLIRLPEGGVSITVCQDKAGTDESIRVAADYIRQHTRASASAPAVNEGDVILNLK